MPTIKEIRKNLDYSLLWAGISDLQSTYSDLKPVIFNVGKIKDTFVQYGFPNVPTGESDFRYAFLDKETLEPIIWDVMTLLHKTKYKLDFTDCDNYAYLCSALISFLYGINTCGTILGRVEDKNTGKIIGGHYFNFPITYKNEIGRAHV